MDRKHALPSRDQLATQETTRLVCLTALRILPTGYQLLMANVEGQSKVSDAGLFFFLVPASAWSPIHLDLLHKGWTGCRKFRKAHLFLTLGIRLFPSRPFTNVTWSTCFLQINLHGA